MELHVYYSHHFKGYDVGNSHPEKPERLDPIINAIKVYQPPRNDSIKIFEPQSATEKDLIRTHSYDLVSLIRKISKSGGGRLNFDTIVTEKTYEIAKLAVGATIQAAVDAFNGEGINSFAVVRPPGHHADMTTTGGFCFFNNIAIAADYLITELKAKRIAILDIDNHYGNGTAQIFYHRNDVLYVSLHSHPQYSYPGCGYPSEIGVDKGKGYTINFPLLPGTDTIDWLFALKYALGFIKQFAPEIILISLGFDGIQDDPVGSLSLEPIAFQSAAFLIKGLAEEMCKGRVAYVLEGGYNINKLGNCTNNLLKGMFGRKPKILEKASEDNISGYTLAIINQVKKAQRNYWRID